MRRKFGWFVFLVMAWLIPAAPRRPAASELKTLEESGMRWRSFDLEGEDAARREAGRAFREFLRVEDLSAGLYVLAAGAQDRQSPHGEDEIYYVVSGKAMIEVDDDVEPVEAGSVIYVKAGVPHRFRDIKQKLKILVVFAPAFGSRVADK